MQNRKWIRLEDMRQLGMRWLLDAMKQIEEEAPGLLDDATLAATELAKGRGSGGNAPQ